MAVIAMIPAHNEAGSIVAALQSLGQQTLRIQRVVVVADNCSDATEELALQQGAEVFCTKDNHLKKAGALNQAIGWLNDQLADEDFLLIMDADTIVSADFVAVSLRTLATESSAGGVSSIFVGRQSDSVLGRLQAMEYFRYQREITRHGNQAFVMSGTASLFKVSALRAVKVARDGVILPRGEGYYDSYSLTEDNEITLALKTLGYTCPAPGVKSITDVMETPRQLYHQRHRWYLGALRNIWAYGFRMPWYLRWTYWRQQAGLVASLLVTLLMTVAICLSIYAATLGWWVFAPIWLVPSGVLLLERLWTVWPMGAKERLIAALLLPEMVYSLYLTLIFGLALKDFARGHKGRWQTT